MTLMIETAEAQKARSLVPVYEVYRRMADKWLRSVWLSDGTILVPEGGDYTILRWPKESEVMDG